MRRGRKKSYDPGFPHLFGGGGGGNGLAWAVKVERRGRLVGVEGVCQVREEKEARAAKGPVGMTAQWRDMTGRKALLLLLLSWPSIGLVLLLLHFSAKGRN